MESRLLALLIGLLTAVSAEAHYIWIEQNGEAKRLYFGEVEEGAREKSPGRLDEIRAPAAEAAGRALKVIRTGNYFDLGKSSARESATALEVTHEVRDWTQYGLGVVKPMFYARYLGSSEAQATGDSLVLDIVPVPERPNSFMLRFKGEPLPKTKVIVVGPNTWTQEFKTDGSGRVTVNTPWRGLYVLEAIHLEKSPGEYQGASYQGVRHRVALSFAQARGEPVRNARPPKSAAD